MPAEVAARLAAAGGPWAALCAICPGLARAERVSRASTSSGLFHAQTGQRYPGSGGEHIYVAVADAADVERFLHALHERAWLAGFAWYDVGAAGQLLDRSLVDRMVGGPERLIFEGAPVIRPPLAQDPAARQPVVTAGDVVDTRRICPQLAGFERAQLAELRRADRERVAEAAEAAQARFITRQATQLVARHGVTLPAARRMVEAQIGGVLLPFVALAWDDPALADCTVADVLADPPRFVGETLADPLEGIAYGRTKAMVMQRPDGSLWIHSFAHGRTIYDLRYDTASLDRAIRAAPKEEMVDTFLQLLSVASLAPDEEIRLRDLVCDLAGVKVRPLDLRIKRGKEERARKSAAAARQKQAAERTDPRPRRPAPSVEDERLPVLTDLDAILCQVPDAEPPMRDVEGRPIEIQVRRPLGLHALTEAGSNDDEPDDKRLPPPELPLLTVHDDVSLAHLIERHVEYALTTDETERVVALPPLFVNHYRDYRASRLPVVAGIVTAPLMLHAGELLAGVGLRRDLGLVFRIDPALLAALPRRAEIEPRHVAAALRFLLDEWLVDVTDGLRRQDGADRARAHDHRAGPAAGAPGLLRHRRAPRRRQDHRDNHGRRRRDRPAAAGRRLVALGRGAPEGAVQLPVPGAGGAGLGQYPARHGDLLPRDREVADHADLSGPDPGRDGDPRRAVDHDPDLHREQHRAGRRHGLALAVRSGSTSRARTRRTGR